MKDKKSKGIILHFTLLAPQLKRSFMLLGSFCVLIFAFCIFATPVFAAEISFDVKADEAVVGQQFQASVILDTEGEEINAVFLEEEDGGYSVIVPALPGCFSEGNNFEEAVKNIKEAIALYLEDERGEKERLRLRPEKEFMAPVELCV